MIKLKKRIHLLIKILKLFNNNINKSLNIIHTFLFQIEKIKNIDKIIHNNIY